MDLGLSNHTLDGCIDVVNLLLLDGGNNGSSSQSTKTREFQVQRDKRPRAAGSTRLNNDLTYCSSSAMMSILGFGVLIITNKLILLVVVINH